MKIRINRNAVTQYIYIYIMLQFMQGRIFTLLGQNNFSLLTWGIGLFYIFTHRNVIKNNSKYVFYVFVIIALNLMTMVYTGGTLSPYTVMSSIARFVILFVAVTYNPQCFIKRYIRLVFFLSCVSLAIFLPTLVLGHEYFAPIYTRLYEIRHTSNYIGSSYGLFLVVYNLMDPTRNGYMFGEPGQYQYILIAALYFVIFKANDLTEKKKYIAIFLITILTIQSTTGLMNLAVFIIVYMLQSTRTVSMKTKTLICGALGVFLVWAVVFSSDDSFIYTSFINKIFEKTGEVNLMVGTGGARILPLLRFGECLKTDLSSVIWGVGYDGIPNTPLLNYCTDGLLNTIMMFGLITVIPLYGFMIRNIIKYKTARYEVFLVLFFIINMGLSQPDHMCVINLMLAFTGLLTRNSAIKVLDRRDMVI